MGYYTQFKLQMEHSNEDAETKILEWADEVSEDDWELCRIVTQGFHESKWYDWEHDMLNLSKQMKDTVFILTGDGEEAGDLWRAFFKNGKHYVVYPELPDFDESKLQ